MLSTEQKEGRAACLVTASEVPALLGEDSRTSYFELWQTKAGNLTRDKTETDAMAWGNALEAPIARQVAKNQGWTIRKVERHLTVPWSDILPEPGVVRRFPDESGLMTNGDLRLREGAAAYPLGASLDYEISGSSLRAGLLPRAYYADDFHDLAQRIGWAPLEIKAVGNFARHGWEGGQPPLPVLLQVQAQLACAPRAPLEVVAGLRSLTGPEDVAKIPRHEPTIKLIFRAVLELELSLARGEAPAPDLDRTSDVEAVIALHKAVTPGKVLDLRQDPKVEQILGDYRSIREVEGCATKEKERLWAELLVHLGPDADFVELIANESKAKRWVIPAAHVEYDKKEGAGFGVYRRKG